MSRCVCNSPCSCYFEFDGDRPGTTYTLPFQNGRYNTRRKGNGTLVDPYVIEFLDSEEFQVEAAQAHSTGTQTVTSVGSGSDGSRAIHINQIDYETPSEIFIAFNSLEASATVHEFAPITHRFWLVSAQATFVNNGLASGMRRLFIQYEGPAGNYGVDSDTIVAGNTSSAALTEDITLSCSGLLPFMDELGDPLFNGPGGTVEIGLMQSSGANMTIKDVRITFVAL